MDKDPAALLLSTGALGLFLIILAILWIMVPFIMLSMNRKLDVNNRRLQRIIELMAEGEEAERDKPPNPPQDEESRQKAWNGQN